MNNYPKTNLHEQVKSNNNQQPLYMIFDLETNGLPNTLDFQFLDYKLSDNYKNSKIVQLSYGIYDDNAQSILEYDTLRNPKEEFEIKNSDIHGVTFERACKDGIDFRLIAEKFYYDLKKVQYLVVHNANFDINIMKSELFLINRQDVIEEIEKKKIVCTMRALTDFCKLPSKFHVENKWPRLSELYKFIFKKDAENLHNSLHDVRNTAACFFVLKKLILFMTDFLDKQEIKNR
jgi:DNA polymerase-3 subunit epsilon